MPGLNLPITKRVIVSTSQTLTIPQWVKTVYMLGIAGGNGGNGGGGSAVGCAGSGGNAGIASVVTYDLTPLTAPKQLTFVIGAAGTPGGGGAPLNGSGGNGTTGGFTSVSNTATGALIHKWSSAHAQIDSPSGGGTTNGLYALSTVDIRAPSTGAGYGGGNRGTAGEASPWGTGGQVNTGNFPGGQRGGGGAAGIGNGGMGGLTGAANSLAPGPGQLGTGYGSGGGGGGAAEGPNSDGVPGAAGAAGKSGVVIVYYDDPTQTNQGDF